MKFYHESIFECVNQVDEVEASTWEEAKANAFMQMSVGDRVVMCEPEAVKEDSRYPDFSFIETELCEKIATLIQGDWVNDEAGKEYWEENIYTFSDDPETYLNSCGEDFDDWRKAE